MRKLVMLALIVLAVSGCQQEAQESHKNGNFNVQFLFQQDGCKVYRFYDGRTVYTTICPNGNASTHSSYSAGKNSTGYDDVSTTHAN